MAPKPLQSFGPQAKKLSLLVQKIRTAEGVRASLRGVGHDSQGLNLGANLRQIPVHGPAADDIGGLNPNLLPLLHQLAEGIPHKRLLVPRVRWIGQQGDCPGGDCFRCIVDGAEGFRVLVFQLPGTLTERFPGVFHPIGLGRGKNPVFAQRPDAVKVGPQRLQGAAALRDIHQHIPVNIIVAQILPQKQVIGIPAAQQIGVVIDDEVLVVHPVVQRPGLQQVYGVVEPGLHIGHGGQGPEMGAGLQIHGAADSVRQNLNPDAPVCRLLESGQNVQPGFVRAKVKGGQNQTFLSGSDQPEPPEHGLPVTVHCGHPFARAAGDGYGLRHRFVNQGRHKGADQQKQRQDTGCTLQRSGKMTAGGGGMLPGCHGNRSFSCFVGWNYPYNPSISQNPGIIYRASPYFPNGRIRGCPVL